MDIRIDRRTFLKGLGLSVTSMGLGGCVKGTLSSGRRHKPPNLIFVFPDQMRGSAMGFLHEEPVMTPNLDRFAEASRVLPQTVSNYPVCSPFRAMFMTGKYPHANQVTSNCNSNTTPFNCQLQQTDTCWSDVLKAAGYSLGYIGKWHLDSPREPYVDCANNRGTLAWNEWCPPERRHGFDFWHAYGTYDYHMRPMYWDTKAERDGFGYVDQWGPEHEADLAIQYLANEDGAYRDPDTPFAMVVSMNPPHTPYSQVPQRYVDRYKDVPLDEMCERPNIPDADTKMGAYYRAHIRNYCAMITGVDEQFGRIMEALKQQGLEQDTLVVFTSDHGNCLGIHNKISKNNRYEESMRIPFMIRWPGKITPGQDDLLFSALDLCPTLLDLMGFGDEISQDVDGKSYAREFLGQGGTRPEWQWYMWVPPGKPAWGQRGIRNQDTTFVIDKVEDKATKYYLHDNKNDPYQLNNIAADNPERIQDLTSVLNRILASYDDPWLKTPLWRES
ncbi:MAG: sulfatase [Planctomycetes bacterium]|nr:sulfatase [Planctomycetota bacterium]